MLSVGDGKILNKDRILASRGSAVHVLHGITHYRAKCLLSLEDFESPCLQPLEVLHFASRFQLLGADKLGLLRKSDEITRDTTNTTFTDSPVESSRMVQLHMQPL